MCGGVVFNMHKYQLLALFGNVYIIYSPDLPAVAIWQHPHSQGGEFIKLFLLVMSKSVRQENLQKLRRCHMATVERLRLIECCFRIMERSS